MLALYREARRLGRAWTVAHILVGAALCLSGVARADTLTPEKQVMTVAMRQYFEGERAGGFAFLGGGLIHLGAASYLVTQDATVARNASYPLFVTGALQLIVGIAVTPAVSGQIRDREARINADPAAFRREELDRLQGVDTTFAWLQGIELAAVAVGTGLAIYGELEDHDALTGVGLGLAVGTALGLMLDFLAAQRGQSYMRALETNVGLTVSPEGAAAAYRATF
jgi:hypothetical protein